MVGRPSDGDFNFTVDPLCSDCCCWDISDALAELRTDPEKPLFRAEGDSYEDCSEAASKLGTVRMVEGILVLPLDVEFAWRLCLDSGDAPLVFLLLIPEDSGAGFVF